MKFRRTAMLLGSLMTLAFALSANATSTTPPTWQSAKVAALPSGARGLPQGFLPALSCPSAGNCSAGGAFNDADNRTQGLVLNEVKGAWASPTKLVAPNGAAGNPQVTVNSISCGSVGSCSAVGSYADKTGSSQSFAANEVNGTWQSAREVTLPLKAVTRAQVSEVHAVSCWSAGSCSAIGDYLDNAQPVSHNEAMAINEVRGTWARATELRLPANANVNPYVIMGQLTCAGDERCVAVGSYIASNNTTHGLIISEVRGTWRTGVAITLPGDANAFPGASLSEIACVSATNCTALGEYTNGAGHNEGMTVSERSGVWQRADAMVMPTDAAPNPHVFFYGYGGLSCPSIGNCGAGGQYLAGTSTYEGFFINEVNGAWGTAAELGLPSGAQMAGKNGGVVAVSCRSAGHCSAGAAYLDGSGLYQGLVINEVGNRWQLGRKITLPTGATSVGVDGGVYGLVCNAHGPCTATGSYLKSATTYEGFTVATS